MRVAVSFTNELLWTEFGNGTVLSRSMFLAGGTGGGGVFSAAEVLARRGIQGGGTLRFSVLSPWFSELAFRFNSEKSLPDVMLSDVDKLGTSKFLFTENNPSGIFISKR